MLSLVARVISLFRQVWFVRVFLFFVTFLTTSTLKFIGESTQHLLTTHLIKKSQKHNLHSYQLTPLPTAKFVELEDGHTCYYLFGPTSGRLIIFLHGFSFYSVLWNLYAAKLVDQGYRVLIFDFFGQGFSEVPSPEKAKKLEKKYWKQGWKLLVTQTDQLVNYLGLQDQTCVIVGHSMGGLIAAKYTEQFPERVSKLILMNPVGSPCHVDFLSHPFSSCLNLLQQIGNIPLVGEVVILGIGAGVWVLTHLFPPKLDDLLSSISEMDRDFHGKSLLEKNLFLIWTSWAHQMLHDAGRPRILLYALRHLPFFGEHLTTYEQIDKKENLETVLIWGLEDSIFPAVCLQNFQQKMPRCKKILLPETNHSSFLERPLLVFDHLVSVLTPPAVSSTH